MSRNLASIFMVYAPWALCLSILMFLFWPPLPMEQETVRALAPPECDRQEVVIIPFPVFTGGGRKGHARPAVDPWKCWFSDQLDDWMCPVPAGGPWE
jgi:hypothetical protein